MLICYFQEGPTYGRRMMKGYLAMKGVHAAETRIGSVLRTMDQPYHEARRQTCYCLRLHILHHQTCVIYVLCVFWCLFMCSYIAQDLKKLMVL